MKLLAGADFLFSKNSLNVTSQKDESEWVYILPDIYNVKTDTEKFLWPWVSLVPIDAPQSKLLITLLAK